MYHLLPFLLLLTSVTGDGNFRFTSTHVIVNETPFTQASFGISRTGGQAQPVTLTCQVSTGCQIYYRAQLFERLLNSSPIDEFGCWCLQSWWSQAMLQHEGEVSMATLRAAPPGTVTLNNSVEYLPTNTYLVLTSRGREGREKLKQKMARKQHAIATTLCKELQASNCVYTLQVTRCPRQRHWATPVQLEKLLTNIASRLTLPKLNLATYNAIHWINLCVVDRAIGFLMFIHWIVIYPIQCLNNRSQNCINLLYCVSCSIVVFITNKFPLCLESKGPITVVQ